MGGFLGNYGPEIAMIGMQFSDACLSLISRAALLQGMSPRVFVVYRQAIATLVIAPFAYFSRRKSDEASIGLKSFSLIFLTTLIGVTMNQNAYFEGLYLASSSIASAMGNLVPAITFLLAAVMGLEKIKIQSMGSMAKIVGTGVCVSGAVSMALLRGPKLLSGTVSGSASSNWVLGCFLLLGASCCWSLRIILQVPVTACYPDHLTLSAWMCFLATLQSAIVTFFLERNSNAWKLHSYLDLLCCLSEGIIGSGISFFVQAWCISQRGPHYFAMFSPLYTLIVTIFAALFLHEEIYTGSLIGAVGVIIGLYIVLWGKANEPTKKEEMVPKIEIDDQNQSKLILIDESEEQRDHKIDLVKPLLSKK